MIELLFTNSKSIMSAMRRAFVVGVGVMAVRMLAFVISAVIARISGVGTFGEYTLFMTIFIIASEVPVALDTTYIRTAARLKHNEDIENILGVAALSKLIYILFIIAISSSVSDYLAMIVFNKPDVGPIIFYSLVSGALYSLFYTLIAFYQQAHNFSVVSALRPLFNILILIFIVHSAVILYEADMQYLMNVYISVAALFSFIAFVWLMRKVNLDTSKLYLDVFNYYKVGGVLLLSSCVALVSNRMDIMFLTKMLDFNQMGIYGAGMRVAILVAVVTAVISTILIPKASHVHGDRNKLKRYLMLSFLYLSLQSILALIVIFFLGDIIVLLFGSEYLSATNVALYLVLQVLFSSYGIPFQALIQCGSKPHYMLFISLSRLVIGLALLSVLVPAYGLLGAGVSVMLTTAILSFLMAMIAFKIVHSDGKEQANTC